LSYVDPKAHALHGDCRGGVYCAADAIRAHLYKIIGRKAGSLPNYGYSSAMKSADFVWDEAKLNRFIASPDEIVPGNNMKPYGGIADRAKILAFLRSLTTGE
jgi:cytochrome c2